MSIAGYLSKNRRTNNYIADLGTPKSEDVRIIIMHVISFEVYIKSSSQVVYESDKRTILQYYNENIMFSDQ